MFKRRRRRKPRSMETILLIAGLLALIKVFEFLESIPPHIWFLLAMAGVTAAILPRLLHLRRRDMMLRSTMADIDRMTGVEFEELLAHYFTVDRYVAQTTPKTGDYGADIVLRKGGEVIVVQAKRYRGSIGIGAVQEVTAAKAHYRASQAMVITNSFFTKAAISLARANRVVLWDRDELCARLEAMEAASKALKQQV